MKIKRLIVYSDSGYKIGLASSITAQAKKVLTKAVKSFRF